MQILAALTYSHLKPLSVTTKVVGLQTDDAQRETLVVRVGKNY